jgi:hypothetical protein
LKKLALFTILGALPVISLAQFSDSFDTDSTANWQFNSTTAGDLAGDNNANEANFFFDYSTVGIASAPRSVGGTTRGLKMEANIFGTTGTATQRGLSASPLGQSFSGDYTLRFDAWQNFQGGAASFAGGGSGTTLITSAGIGGVTNVSQTPINTLNGVLFGASSDGGSANDYRAYTATGSIVAETTGAYFAGNTSGVTNNTNAYYSNFQGTVPGAQTTYAATLGSFVQSGQTNVGVLGMAWHTWEITKVGDVVTWSVDGKNIARVTKSITDGSNIFVGMFDINSGVSVDAYSRQLSFGLIDNVEVVAAPVPEPTSMIALGLGAAALIRRRRSSK